MKLQTISALNLKLQGSTGSFKVGSPNSRETFEVKYLLTHVGLNFNEGSDERLLKELAPVREIFDFKSLDFDEIMQRDIDDARVSSELIPYILDDESKDLVKFFPPIVVVALPIKNDANKPLDYYPKVKNEVEKRRDHPTGVEDWAVVQSGEDGKEVFKFEQPILSGVPQLHDLVSLNLNTSKCRLIIVDGQHRAMALLALYRNLKEDWSDSRRKPFESYYKEWTPEYIRKFNLDEIRLPMIICTIPELDENYSSASGAYDLKKASRSIFLTLNKTARKVSRSRNLLLDDSDLISSFMRKVLSKIKNGDSNFLSSTSLEIHNVELDQGGDRQVITSPMAFTGVPHLHYITEHLMLDSGDVTGVRKRDGRFSTRAKGTYISVLLQRLDADNTLGQDAYSSITRNVFTTNDEKVLCETFMSSYGKCILKSLTGFFPFKAYANATQAIKIASDSVDVHIKPMLFDGQGIARVFEDHRKSLEHRLDEGYFKHDVPKLKLFKAELDRINNSYELMVSRFERELTINFFSGMQANFYSSKEPGGDLVPYSNAVSWVTKVYRNIFQTVAFQAALVCGFFSQFEKASAELELNLDECFDEYLEQINTYFSPTTYSKFRNLSELLIGHTDGENFSNIEISEGSPFTFRNVVFPNEMSPDEWPKYRYIILEIWNPSHSEFNDVIEVERNICRQQIITSLYDRYIKDYSKENMRHISDLTKDEKEAQFSLAFSNFKDMLRRLNKASVLDESVCRRYVSDSFI